MKCHKCNKDTIGAVLDGDEGIMYLCQEHFDEVSIIRTGRKWSDVPEG